MNILVVYYSKGGNTRKLAEAVAEGVDAVEGASARLRTTSEVSQEEFSNAAGVIAGSPVYFGGMAAEMKKVFDDFIGVRKRMEGKVGAVFTTGGAMAGGMETTMMGMIQAMLIYGMVIVGDPMAATGHYGAAAKGAPDEAALDVGRKLGQRVAELCRKIV
jgi:NAD(P)H dehydrogenase (quinone)